MAHVRFPAKQGTHARTGVVEFGPEGQPCRRDSYRRQAAARLRPGDVALLQHVKQQRVCGPVRPCHRPGQSTTLTIASTVVTSPSARAQWR